MDKVIDTFSFEVYFRDEKTAEVDVGESRVHINRLVIHPAKQIFY